MFKNPNKPNLTKCICLQLSQQSGSEEAADMALFGSKSPDKNCFLKQDRNREVFARRASVRDFVEMKKESTSIDGNTLENLVDSHRKCASKCRLCQEDIENEETYTTW